MFGDIDLSSGSHFHPFWARFAIELNDLEWSSEMARWKALARGFPTGHLRRSSGFVEFGCEARESGIFWGWKWGHSKNENKPATDAPNGAYYRTVTSGKTKEGPHKQNFFGHPQLVGRHPQM